MKKKTRLQLFFCMSLLCLVTGASSVFADQQTVVNYEVSGSYTLIIPAKVSLSFLDITEMAVSTVNRNLPPGGRVEVALIDGLTADGEITLEREHSTGDTLISSIKVNDQKVTEANRLIGTFSGFVKEESVVETIQFGIPQGKRLAGSYKTILTFSALYKE